MSAGMKIGLRWILWSTLIFSTNTLGFAQNNALQPGHEDAAWAVVTFELKWPAADPQSYSISVEPSGRGSYQSQPRADAKDGKKDASEPFTMKFIVSEPTRAKIFEMAKSLNYFNGNFESKYNVARTGDKTLTYRSGDKESKTTLNYSSNPQMNALIDIFQKMSTTFEMSRKLDYDIRFDKLGLERDLKTMEEMNKNHALMELQVLSPTLERIATDPSVMNISRQRARRLLDTAQVAIGSR